MTTAATRKSLEPCDIAWAAGLFEGEGCISVQRDNRQSGRSSRYTYLSLKMTDEDVVRRFAAIAGAGNVNRHHPPSKQKHKVQWLWALAGERAEEFAWAMMPHLGTRRRTRFMEVLEEVRSVR